jgi:4-hydroxy-4-methyl-2-oxoglutarate aldolase
MSLIGKVYPAPDSEVDDLINAAKSLTVATIAAAMPEPVGRNSIIAQGVLHRMNGSGTMVGPAVTVWSPPGNNTMFRFGMQTTRPGDVYVLVTPTLGAAQWGDLATVWAIGRELAGGIVFGSVRDLAEIHKTDFPLWGADVDPRQSLKISIGYVNAPVDIAGHRIAPGDLVVADDDAVMTLTPAEARMAIPLAQKRAEKEALVLQDAWKGLTSPHLPYVSEDGIERMTKPWSPDEA